MPQAKVALPPRQDGAERSLVIDRLEPDFGARERELLETLQPHLARPIAEADAQRTNASDCGVSTREFEVLELVRVGRTNADIAAELCISPHTVRKHLEHAYAKLHVHTRCQAVASTGRRADARQSPPPQFTLRGRAFFADYAAERPVVPA